MSVKMGSLCPRRPPIPSFGPSSTRRPRSLLRRCTNKGAKPPTRRFLHSQTITTTRATIPSYKNNQTTRLQPRRTFISTAQQNPPSPSHNTTITSHRLLPYPTLPIYNLITSISDYPHFLPYCRSARVTSLSPQPDRHYDRRWPHTADLTVGFQDRISESFTSRVFCLPPVAEKGRAGTGWVEAVSGSEFDASELAGLFGGAEQDDLAHHFMLPETLNEEQQERLVEERKVASGESPLAYLRSRWSVQGIPYKPGPDEPEQRPQETNLEPNAKAREMTEVGLAIEFRFRSPIYEVMSKTVTGKVADMMVQAFVGRVEEKFGKGSGEE
ncbi:MAG: hypothetical protein M1831_003874 [Alyxoria varia]|nr:MAG: hypothetical protein M1831_003874 [Alyxoria varia]